jgi:Ca2+-binding RTX toxin-like protein
VHRRPRSRRILGSGGVLLALLLGAATLFAAGLMRRGPTSPGIRTVASGAISVSDSKDGAAIFDLSGIGPGSRGQGEVTIGNTGSAPGTLTLSSFDRSDAPGLYGGALSGRLDLRIADVTAGNDTEVYVGGLASMPELGLGTLAAGGSRTYRLSVSMRDGGSPSSPYVDDNLYQRAGTSLGYSWTLTEAETVEEPPEPIPPVSGSPVSAPPEEITPPPDPGTGRQSVFGDAHPNSLFGRAGDDLIYGFGAADVIFGRGGDDDLLGGPGADRVYGGSGNDRLRGGIGPDHIYGGPGADVLFARDGQADFVECGSGIDTAYVDQHDRTKNCETVRRRYHRLFSIQVPR